MGTAKRERQKANRQARLEELAKQSQRKQTKKRTLQIVGGIAALLALFFILAFVVGGDDDGDDAEVDTSVTFTAPPETDPSASTATPATTEAPPETVPGRTISGETPCPADDGSEERAVLFAQAPPMCIDPAKSYSAEITTNHGAFTVELDAAAAPNTVNNFVVLARYHYFDNTVCHRAMPGFVVQCGDPSGTGTGGAEGFPGYQFDDELPADGEYQVGSVAMANAGANTNGSQFFVITGVGGVGLPPNYSLFGQVSEGLDTTVTALDALGNPDQAANGVPTLGLIVIESVTITEA